MRARLPIALVSTAVIIIASSAEAQVSRPVGQSAGNEFAAPKSSLGQVPVPPDNLNDSLPARPGLSETSTVGERTPPPTDGRRVMEQMVALQNEVNALTDRLRAMQKADPQDDKLKKQVELLQKQIETQQKMIQLLQDQMKKQPSSPALEKLQMDSASLQSRSRQAAQRDQELSQAIGDLTEQRDADRRYEPRLPSTLKELFLPSQTNESPLSIYGQFFEAYQQINGQAGTFASPDIAPFFLVQLNDKFLLEATIDVSNAGVEVGNAQVDWFVNDHLTVVVGRFITPFGFFNERLNHEWINKLPDVPIMFQQVSPLSSTDGVQLRGATYVFGSPVKIEYSLFGGNGFRLPDSAVGAGLNAVADLAALSGTDEVAAKAVGGRVGFWVPCWGLNGGVSTYLQNGYSPGDKDHLQLWGCDLGWHKGNWDSRFEFASVHQQAATFIGNNIERTGLYAQLAYRPYDCENRLLRNTELVGAYSMALFKGIDPTQLAPFDDPRAVPVDRDQWIFGINHYFYASMALKFAYEINVERPPNSLHDNVFLAQFVWAF